MVVLPFLIAKQLAKAPFSVIWPVSWFVQKSKHGIDSPLMTRKSIKQSAIFHVRQTGVRFNYLAFYQASRSNMPVEHSPISDADFRLTANAIHEIGERLDAPQHQTEFSIGMNQVRQ